MQKLLKNKKGQSGGLVTGLVFGIASLVIAIIVALVIITTMDSAGLLDANNDAFMLNQTVDNLTANFTEGINNVADKIPTILLVAAIVLILGVLAILVGVWQRMRLGGGSL